MMKITMHPELSKACIVLESRDDIRRMQEIFSMGINCKADRGKDVELIADVLLAAKESKVPAHG
jgi:hypothetical protein